MRLQFNRLALGTFGRLVDIQEFIRFFDESIPIVQQRATEALKLEAEQKGWDYPDYVAESQVLDERFALWMPRFSAYSCLILLYSIVETQLLAYAEEVGRKLDSRLQVNDIRGRGVQQTSLYLRKVASIDVSEDPSWKDIDNLRELRNLIVHRGGRPGKTREQQDLVDRLSKQYPLYIQLPDAWPPHQQLWVSMRLCSHLATEIESFFKRLFKRVGFSEKGSEFV